MASLANQTISSTYDGLIKTSSDNAVPVSGVQALEDGSGNALALSVGRSGNGVTVSGNLAVDTNTLYVDAANNRVGIGISSGLAEALDVNGNINLRGGQINAAADGSNTFFANAIQHIFRAGSSGSFAERMRIDSSGNVGIGTSSPDARFSVVSASANSSSAKIGGIEYGGTQRGLTIKTFQSGGGDDCGVEFNAAEGLAGYGSFVFKADTAERMRIDSSGNVLLKGTGTTSLLKFDSSSYGQIQATGGTLYYDVDTQIFRNNAGGEYMRIDSSGNVGIGVTPKTWSVGTALEVARNGSAIWSNGQGETNIMANIYYDGGYKYAATGAYGARINVGNTNGNILFYTDSSSGTAGSTSGATERMRITSSGDLLVGATALSEVNNIVDGHLLEANSQSAGNGAVGVYNNSGTANCPALVVLNRDTSTDSTNRFIQFYANVTDAGATAMGGIVGNGASNVQFASLSDEREKENIVEITGSLDKIMQLQVSEFDWIASGEHIKAGFIAQNVETVFPEYVIENVAGEGQEARKGITGGMSAGYIAHLTKAIQELKAEIETLKSQLNA